MARILAWDDSEDQGETESAEWIIALLARHAFVDTVQVLLKHPLTTAQLHRLDQQCARRLNDKPEGGPWWRRITLQQPSQSALQYLHEIAHGYMIHRVDLSLDVIFETQNALAAAHRVILMQSAQPWHDGNTWRDHDTAYNGPATSANQLVSYSDKPSKVAGEPYCLHIEWRAQKAHAVRRLGIEGLLDIIDFDHVAFWQEHLVLYDRIDFAKLGRLMNNKIHRTKRRARWLARWSKHGYDLDYREGTRMAQIARQWLPGFESATRPFGAIQDIVDFWGSRIDLRAVKKRISAKPLLPLKSEIHRFRYDKRSPEKKLIK